MRLFFVLFGLLAVALGLYTHAIVREQRARMMEEVLQSADRVSDVIQRTTRAAMMRNQRTELHEMTENIGDQPGFEGVRVFNKVGWAREAYRLHPMDLWIPSLFIATLVLCANFIADGLRDALDPRTRET